MVSSTAQPPSDRRLFVAIAATPLLVLAAFGLAGAEWIDFEVAVAVALACAVWVVYELHDCQRELDEYNLRSLQDDGIWRGADTAEPQLDSRFY